MNRLALIYRAILVALFLTSCSNIDTTEPSNPSSSYISSSDDLIPYSHELSSSSFYSHSNLSSKVPKSSIQLTSSSKNEFNYSSSDLTQTSSSFQKTGFVKFTFDDAYIDSWYLVRDSLLKYDIRATFFISGFSNLNTDKINKLHELQDLGFEIGHHTHNHIDAVSFLEEHSHEEYFTQEIEQDLNEMNKAGFDIKSFAYPFGKGTPQLDSLLLQDFSHLRYVAESQRNGPIKNLSMFDEGLSIAPNPAISSGIGIDSNYQTPTHLIHKALQEAHDNNKTLTFYAHKIVEEDPKPYQIKLSTLISISKEAKRLGLKSITFSQAE